MSSTKSPNENPAEAVLARGIFTLTNRPQDVDRFGQAGNVPPHPSTEVERRLVEAVSEAVRDWFGSYQSDFIRCDIMECDLIGRSVLLQTRELLKEPSEQ
jgi:hypothetical protein